MAKKDVCKTRKQTGYISMFLKTGSRQRKKHKKKIKERNKKKMKDTRKNTKDTKKRKNKKKQFETKPFY